MPDVQNDDQQPRMAEIDATESIPPDWHDQPVWISSYRVFRLPASALLKTEPFDLLGVRAQLFWGRAYLELTADATTAARPVAWLRSQWWREWRTRPGAVSPAYDPNGV